MENYPIILSPVSYRNTLMDLIDRAIGLGNHLFAEYFVDGGIIHEDNKNFYGDAGEFYTLFEQINVVSGLLGCSKEEIEDIQLRYCINPHMNLCTLWEFIKKN